MSIRQYVDAETANKNVFFKKLLAMNEVFLALSVVLMHNEKLAISFVYKCNNNRYDTKCDKCAWHNKILTNRLWFICLFFNLNKTA